MSQLILYQGACGIVLATDSRAVTFTETGEPSYFTLSKLYPLSATVLMATLGAGYGHTVCRAFQERIRGSKTIRGKEILEMALPFLQETLQIHRERNGTYETDPELQKVYFIIAGDVTDRPEEPLGFAVYAAEFAADLLHPLSTAHFVCIPRQLSLEARLQQLPSDEVSCEQVEELCTNFLTRLAASSEDIGEPFVLSRITALGTYSRAVTSSPKRKF